VPAHRLLKGALVDKLKQVWDQEPAVILGIVGSVVVFAVEQFAGKGIITADTSQNIQNLVTALIPLIASLLTRSQVTPA
jgi:hypothetical protein